MYLLYNRYNNKGEMEIEIFSVPISPNFIIKAIVSAKGVHSAHEEKNHWLSKSITTESRKVEAPKSDVRCRKGVNSG